MLDGAGSQAQPQPEWAAAPAAPSPAVAEQAGSGGHGAALAAVREKIAFVLGATPDDIEIEQPLIELGIDSLAAAELASWASTTYGIELSQTEFLSGLTTAQLVESIEGGEADLPVAASAPSMAAQPAHDPSISGLAAASASTAEPSDQRIVALNGAGSQAELAPEWAAAPAAPSPAVAERPDDGHGSALAAVREKIAFVLGATPDDIEIEQPLIELGIDSLAAAELASWASTTYGIELSQTEFLSGLTTAQLVENIEGGEADLSVAASAPSMAAQPAHDPSVSSLAAVSTSSHEPSDQRIVALNGAGTRAEPQPEWAAAPAAPSPATAEQTGNGHSSALGAVREKIAFVLGATPDDIEIEQPLIELGIDSLAAAELASWASTTYGIELSQTEFLSGLTTGPACGEHRGRRRRLVRRGEHAIDGRANRA